MGLKKVGDTSTSFSAAQVMMLSAEGTTGTAITTAAAGGGEGEGEGGSGLTDDFFDRPFVPRMADGADADEATTPTDSNTRATTNSSSSGSGVSAKGQAEREEEEDVQLLSDIKAGVEHPVLASLRTARSTLSSVDSSTDTPTTAAGTATAGTVCVPPGVWVRVSGLLSRGGMQYNGASGVVVSLPQAGRQGVRLDAPFR